MPDNTPMLQLEDIYKSFFHQGNRIEVLKGINVSIYSGDSLAVMGASGVGKSTLLNIIGSLESPTSGRVKFGDQDLYDWNETALSQFRNKEIGFVFQFHHLLPELNALENTMMPALIARLPRYRAAQRATEVLEKVGLEKRLSHRAGELSGGEQQRVAIARALIMKPRLILADEPTGNLDWQTGHEIAELLVRINKKEHVALVIATHNRAFAQRMTRQKEMIGGRFQ